MSATQVNNNSTAISYALTVDTEQATQQVKKLQHALVGVLHLVSRFTGGNEELDKMISFALKAIATVNALNAAIKALELSSGPIGWLLFGVGVASSAFMGYDAFTSISGY